MGFLENDDRENHHGANNPRGARFFHPSKKGNRPETQFYTNKFTLSSKTCMFTTEKEAEKAKEAKRKKERVKKSQKGSESKRG